MKQAVVLNINGQDYEVLIESNHKRYRRATWFYGGRLLFKRGQELFCMPSTYKKKDMIIPGGFTAI